MTTCDCAAVNEHGVSLAKVANARLFNLYFKKTAWFFQVGDASAFKADYKKSTMKIESQAFDFHSKAKRIWSITAL